MMKTKYTIEFNMKSTPPSLLWMYVSTPHGLGQWFADEVEQDGKKITFYWDKYPTDAIQLSSRSGERVKYRWADDDEKTYFEFNILTSELTGDTLLVVVDFAIEDEMDESKALWEKQLKVLKRKLGCK